MSAADLSPSGPLDDVSPHSHPRPRIMSYPSNSAPSTPQQHARDSMRSIRTPSPKSQIRHRSPRSASAESNRGLPSMRAVSERCKFQSTQTMRRRMPYNIGAEPLMAEKPSWNMTRDRRQQVTQQCEALYEKLLPSADSQRRRDELVVKLERILREEMPQDDVKVGVFGSSGNLLCTSDSDVDVCVTLTGNGIVCSIASILARRAMAKVTCVHAKAVPIVKIWDPELEMACDLNVNNQVALINTRLVRAYMQIGTSARKLAMLVKYWTQQRVINEASGGTLSSYTWTLLVINFLQINNVLPVIPLHDEHGNKKDDFSADVENFKDFGPITTPSVGDLFYNFFIHYGYEVDFETAVFSVRQGAILPKAQSRWSRIANNNRLCVEEPFNNDRNLGNTADDTAVRGLHTELRDAAKSMGNGIVDVDGDVCKQFEFPQDEPRYAIFEKPPPQPRPILTRSRSQAGRGGRGGLGSRSNNRGYDHRSAAASRRASSATTYGPVPVGLMPPDMWPQIDPYTIQQDLHNLTRHLSHEQERLRLVQQAIMEQRMQQANLGSSSNRGSYVGPSMQSQPGSPGPQTSVFENGPRNAPLFAGPGNGPRLEHSVPMSQTSSYQGTSTKPSSPMMADAVPLRRSTQQQFQVPDSPGMSQRSRSQPARPGAPVMPQGYHYMQWNPPGQYQLYAGHQQRYPHMMPSYQFVDQRGIRYMHIGNAAPREYVGYGINPIMTQAPSGIELSSIPAYEDLQRQGRPRSPVPREDEITYAVSPPRSSSAVSSIIDDYNGIQSAPIPGFRGNARRSGSGSLVESQGPVIANGSGTSNGAGLPSSHHALSSSHDSLNDNIVGLHMSQVHRASDGAPRSFADRAAAMNPTWSQQQGLMFFDQSDTGSSYDDSASYQDGDNLNSSQDLLPVPTISQPPTERRVEGDALHPGADHIPPDDAGPQNSSSAETNSNGQRRQASNGRPNVSHLDLSVPGRLRERAPSASKILSPVQETRTPSPTTSRKRDSQWENPADRKSPQAAPLPSPKARLTDAAPSPTVSTHQNPTNGSVGPSAPPKAAVGAQNGKQGAPSSNPWQQAGGRRKKGKSAQGEVHSSRGEPMPANAAERKGG